MQATTIIFLQDLDREGDLHVCLRVYSLVSDTPLLHFSLTQQYHEEMVPMTSAQYEALSLLPHTNGEAPAGRPALTHRLRMWRDIVAEVGFFVDPSKPYRFWGGVTSSSIPYTRFRSLFLLWETMVLDAICGLSRTRSKVAKLQRFVSLRRIFKHGSLNTDTILGP